MAQAIPPVPNATAKRRSHAILAAGQAKSDATAVAAKVNTDALYATAQDTKRSHTHRRFSTPTNGSGTNQSLSTESRHSTGGRVAQAVIQKGTKSVHHATAKGQKHAPTAPDKARSNAANARQQEWSLAKHATATNRCSTNGT